MNILLSIPALVWIIASAIVYAFGEYYSKKFALNPSWNKAILIAAIYAFDAFLWLPAIFQKKQITTTTLLWTVMSMVAIAIVGLFIFQEKLNPTQWIGISFAVISIFLLSI